MGGVWACSDESKIQMMSEKVSILVVDDPALERLIVSHVLRKDPRFVVTALTCGQEALEYVEVHRPGMIVTDLRMSGMNGLEVIENLRNAGQSIPVVLMTSCVSEDLVVQAFQPRNLFLQYSRLRSPVISDGRAASCELLNSPLIAFL